MQSVRDVLRQSVRYVGGGETGLMQSVRDVLRQSALRRVRGVC